MRPVMTMLLLTVVACQDTKKDRGEGADEDDPSSAYDTGEPGGIDRPEPIDWSSMPAEPAAEEVCYLGRDGAGTTCLPTVWWSAEWGDHYDYPPPLDGDPQYAAPVRYLDLSADEADPDLYVAPNFQLDELVQEHKGRFGLFQSHAVASLQDLRDTIGGALYINSAYRNVDYNAGVGGATWSRHQYGDAVDIRSDDASLSELAAMCEDLGAGFTSIYTSHVHCDWRDTPLDPAFYGARDSSGSSMHAHETVSADLYRVGTRGLAVETVGFDEGTPRMLWQALDAAGHVLAEGSGAVFDAPDGTDLVRVDVGGAVTLAVRP